MCLVHDNMLLALNVVCKGDLSHLFDLNCFVFISFDNIHKDWTVMYSSPFRGTESNS